MNYCAECRQEVPEHLQMIHAGKTFCSLPCMQMSKIPALRSEPLTKREQFAMAAMQGLCFNGENCPLIVAASIRIADALIKQLEETT